MNYTGTAGSDTRQGTADADHFDMAQGGNDTVNGNDGDDVIDFGATLTAADRINGGAGWDKLVLDGDYGSGLTFNATTVRFVEELEMTQGHSYHIITSNNTVAAGQMMRVSAYGVGAGNSGHSLHFDASAETDGGFWVFDSFGDDVIIGGQGYDSLSMSYGGADYFDAQGGDDQINAGNNFGPGDVIDGGEGNDTVYFGGPAAGTILLTGDNFRSIEFVALSDGQTDMSILLDGTVLEQGEVFAFDARGVDPGKLIEVDGGAETLGSFDFYGGRGNDRFAGGAGNDLFRMGGGGTDILSGNLGDDVFGMTDTFDATDVISGGAGYDTLDLMGNYAGGVQLGASTITGIERITLRGGDFTYRLTFADGNLNHDEAIGIDGVDLGAGHFLYLDASAETSAGYSMGDSTGDDTLIGGGGRDVFWLERGGRDKVTGGGGDDLLIVRGGVAGEDKFTGGAGSDTISLHLASKAVSVDLAAGTWSVNGVKGGTLVQVENVDASAFGDVITGNHVANIIRAGLGNDTVSGGQGDDWLQGEGGHDTLNGDGGADTLEGGEGNDTLDGGAQDDVLLGEAGTDTLYGGAGNDELDGGTQNDQLYGGAGIDALMGGDGHDRLDGGTQNDILTGGQGRDTFVFSTGTGRDVITDFANNQDYLDFSASAAATFADVQAHMYQSGNDVVIDYGADRLTLLNISLGQVDASDFLF